MMKNFLLMLAVLTLFATLPVMAADAASRREAARLAAQKAEEATRAAAGVTASTPAGSGSARPAATPPAVDEKHVEIVSADEVTLHGAGDLVGNRYLLREIDGEAVAEDSDAFVEWRNKTSMNGKLCNLFRAASSFENTVVKAEELPATTRMACADEAMGAVEKRFFAALKLGMSFVAIGDFLEMRRDDLVLRFTLDKEEPEAEEKAEETPAEAEEEEADAAAEPAAADESATGEPAPAAPAGESAGEEASASAPLVSEAIIVEEDLLDHKFVLAKVDGEDFILTTGRQPFIEFGEGMRVGGSACNTFTGLGTLTDGKLVVANAVATRMMCIDARVSEFEQYFHKMLREGVDIAVDSGTLVMTGDGRTLEFVEER